MTGVVEPGAPRGVVFVRTLHTMRRGLLGWMIGLAVLAASMLAMYPTIRDNDSMSQLVTSYPSTVRELFNLDDLTSGVGYLRAEVFSLVLPVMLIIAAVFWGSESIAGEEASGTLDLLLSYPISRRQVFAEKAASVLVSIAFVTLALGAALVPGTMIVKLDVGMGRLAAALAAVFLLGVTFGALGLMLGAATGRRGVARGAPIVAAVVSYLVSSLAGIVSWLRPLRFASPWYHALGTDPLRRGLLLGHLGVLALGALVLCVLGAELFERRDLAR
jgi:ABC-2 type transport system permease protein